MGTMENSEDLDEITYHAAFYQGLHRLLIQRKNTILFLRNYNL